MSTSSCSENNKLRDCETFSGTLPPQNPSKTSTHSHFCTIFSTCSSECPTTKNSFWKYFHTSCKILWHENVYKFFPIPITPREIRWSETRALKAVVTKWPQVASNNNPKTLPLISQNHNVQQTMWLFACCRLVFLSVCSKALKKETKLIPSQTVQSFWCSSLATMVLVTNLSWSIQLSRKLQHHKIQWHVKTAFCHFFLQFHGLESKGIHRNW